MRIIKKINELFDDEFQREINKEIPKEELVNLNGPDFKNPISKFFKKISYSIPVLNRCMNDSDDDHFLVYENDVINFIIRNSEYYLCVSFYFEELSKANFCILYQKCDYKGDIFVGFEHSEPEYCHISDFENKTSDETVDILKNTFVPLLKRFKFTEEYSSDKETNLSRKN
jgi:hypothetical protein